MILHMSLITQRGDSALIEAAIVGEIEVVVELVKAGANVDLQTDVCQYIYVMKGVHIHSNFQQTSYIQDSICSYRAHAVFSR